MKKGVIIVVLLGMLLVLPLVQAQTYSGFNRFTDNVKLAFSGGDNKVRLALEIREKEVDSAINNIQNQDEDKAIKNLERAREKIRLVQEKVSLDTSEEIKTSVERVIDKVTEEELSDEFEDYLFEEEKTILIVVLTEKTYEYCKELAKEDFNLMLQEEICNPETAVEGLEEELKELKDIQIKLFVQLMLEIRSCMDDPGTCNCEANTNIEQKAKCEKMVALAIKCEYKEDETSCNELNSLDAPKAESFVPDFLMNLFRAKEEQMLWGEKPSDCVPEECWDENDKPECRQYDKFKETKEDWDEYGNFIGTKNKCGKEGSIPTMKESIPQCFDGDIFLEEKCGKITMVKNEDGLINYLIEKEIEVIINDFENKSAQHTIDVGGEGIDEGNWTIDEGEWVIDGEQVQVGNKVREIKRDMNQINNQIKDITYAAGTGPGGDATNDVDNIIINMDGGDGGGSGGDIVDNVVAGDSGGNNVVDNEVAGDGNRGYASGTSAGGDDGDTIDAGDVVVDGDGSGTVDNGGGEPDVIDED